MLSATSFVEGVRGGIATGGCNASRTIFAGACLAALYARQGNSELIPKDWAAKTINYQRAVVLSSTLISLRGDPKL